LLRQAPVWREAYDADPAVIYALDDGLRIVRCNPAWDRFARENGASDLYGSRVSGLAIMDVVPKALRDYYVEAYEAVRKFHREWWHIFDCSSPGLFRSFQMRILPGDPGIVVINTLLHEEPSGPDQTVRRLEQYTDAEGIITMCAHCRRVEHLTQPGRWDWAPSLLRANQALVKPSLCGFCTAYHYPGRKR